MTCKQRAAVFFVLLTGSATSAIADESILKRHYEEGETLRYEIEGTHSVDGKITSSYRAHAVSSVKKGTSEVFYEEIQWEKAWRDGKEIHLSPDDVGFRQLLSLDPSSNSFIPDLSKVNPVLFGPITDLMTFYVDDQLAIRRGLRESANHFYESYGKPASWADGRRITVGYDCIDFDVTLTNIDTVQKIATLKVRHVPPPHGCETVPAEWMRKTVSDTANNWFQVRREADGSCEAGAGKEIFEAEIKVLLGSGIIKSATLFNPVDLEQRTCKDAQLSVCEAPRKIRIVRRINLTLVEAAPGASWKTLSDRMAELSRAGRYAEAAQAGEKATIAAEESFGDSDLKLAGILDVLAVVYFAQGDFAKATPLAQRALSIYESRVGKNSREIVNPAKILGAIYLMTGDLDKSEPLLRHAVKLSRRFFGKWHPETAKQLGNLGALYMAREKSANARHHFEEALVIWGENPDPVYGAMTMVNLAKVCASDGDSKRAGSLFRKALALREQAFGRDHTQTKNIADSYAEFQKKAGALDNP